MKAIFRILLPCLLIITGIYQGSSQVFSPFKEVDSIPEGKGVIYIYLPSKLGKLCDYVFINGKLASNFPLYENGCLTIFADPGENSIHARIWRKSDLIVQVKPGEAVFVKGLYNTGETSFRQVPGKTALKELIKYKVYDNRSKIKLKNCRSIALISTTISKPVGGFTYGESVEKRLCEDLVKIEKQYLDPIRELTAKELQRYFSARIIFGDSLNTIPDIKMLKPKYNKVLQVMVDEKRSFPYILSDSLDLKPFSHFRGDITKFFKDTANYKSVIHEIARAAKTDLIAICNTYGSIDESFIIYMNTELFLFSPDGSLFATAGKTVVSCNRPDKKDGFGRAVYTATDFGEALQLFPITLTLTLEEIAADLRKK